MKKAKILLKSRLILEQNGLIMMLKQTTRNGGKYTLVGGTVEDDEFGIDGLIRETREEAGVKLKAVDLELVHTLHKKREKDTRIILYFKAKHYKGELEAKEKRKFKKVSWFPIDDLPKNTSNTVRFVLKKYRNGIRYSEYPSLLGKPLNR